MPDEPLQSTNDKVLLPFLSAETEAETEECANSLFAQIVIPEIQKSLARYPTLTPHEKDDISANALTKIWGKLRRLRLNLHLKKPRTSPIQHLSDYVSAVTENCRKDLILAKKPAWRWAHNRLKMLRDEGVLKFFSDEKGNHAVCLDSMPQLLSEIELGEIIARVCENLPSHLFLKIQELVPIILETAKGALLKNDLIRAYLEISGSANFEEIEMPEETSEYLSYDENEFVLANRRETYLHIIWAEIKKLKPHLRKVALLSLKESRKTEAITLLLKKRIATRREIADALEMSLDEFYAIFEKLPMSSRDIALFLGIEDGEKTSKEQKIDNLRKEVRKILRKRLGIKR